MPSEIVTKGVLRSHPSIAPSGLEGRQGRKIKKSRTTYKSCELYICNTMWSKGHQPKSKEKLSIPHEIVCFNSCVDRISKTAAAKPQQAAQPQHREKKRVLFVKERYVGIFPFIFKDQSSLYTHLGWGCWLLEGFP